MQDIPFEIKEKLYEYLSGFITPEKKAKFDQNIQMRSRHLTVVLEDIFQPHNASAVLRSCECFGIQDVHIIENNNEYEVNPQVALGASNWLNLYHYNSAINNTPVCFEALKKQGYTIVATTPHENSCYLDELDISNKTALVFGTEKEGLSETAIKEADKFVKIPMYGFTESFNISVSAALCLFHLSEKMRKSKINWQLSPNEQTNIKIQWVKQCLRDGEILEKHFIEKQ